MSVSTLNRFRRKRRWCAVSLLVGAAGPTILYAHIFVSRRDQAGSYPAYEGSGWVAEVFLNLPDSAAATLISAEDYADLITPSLTFKTEWIDFPPGPDAARPDADFKTLADFFGPDIFDVSDPSMLDQPMSHMVVRFHGLIKITIGEEVRIRDSIGLPVWTDTGTMGYDGYRVTIVNTIYRRPDVNPDNVPWDQFGPATAAQGLFPIEIAYFNRYDPRAFFGAPNAGIELYSWHGSDRAYPAGQQMVHEVFGVGTLLPPRVIYQPEDVLPHPLGDYDGDADIDLLDWQWAQICYNADPNAIPFLYPVGCEDLDFNEDGRVGDGDIAAFNAATTGP